LDFTGAIKMSHTIRAWQKTNLKKDRPYPAKWLIDPDLYTPPWKLTAMSFFGYHKKRILRKFERHSIRCHHRTMFAHGRFDNIINYKNSSGEYFD
jgi:hypothetical protein